MCRRQPLPRLWLMTDERGGDVLAAIAGLPRGSGIVFRHYATPPDVRRRLFRAVQTAARAGRHMLLLADTPQRAHQWGADGAHERSKRTARGVRTMGVHNAREGALARRMRADLIFVSPIFETASHRGARWLGAKGVGRVGGLDRKRTIALGGMNAARFRKLGALGLYGWAGIDALTVPPRQNLKAVPT